MKDYNGCNALFDTGNSCTWIVLLVGAYFFLSNGCIGNIFGECDNNIIWIILLFLFLFMHNGHGCKSHC